MSLVLPICISFIPGDIRRLGNQRHGANADRCHCRWCRGCYRPALSYVGESSSIPNALTPTKTNAIILPGFIDLHNHLTWNILPRWILNRKFGNRYDWQDTAEYDRLLVAPHLAAMSVAGCEAEVYAEIKALIGGATSVVGSSSNKGCAAELVRNLDVSSGLGFIPPGPLDPCEPKPPKPLQPLQDFVANEVFPLEIPYERVAFLKCELEAGNLRSLVVHLSEGAPTDASAHREFNMLKSAGLLMPGLVIVHGTALQPKDFGDMAAAQVGLVWSPRSNDELYGATTNVAAAQHASVSIAIGRLRRSCCVGSNQSATRSSARASGIRSW
jgi:5-methylthioadenosine/S-adenosylhomocysteine deaminase